MVSIVFITQIKKFDIFNKKNNNLFLLYYFNKNESI